jgi:hypothetical protein
MVSHQVSLDHRKFFAAIQANHMCSKDRLPYRHRRHRLWRFGCAPFGIVQRVKNLLDQLGQLIGGYAVIAHVGGDDFCCQPEQLIMIGHCLLPTRLSARLTTIETFGASSSSVCSWWRTVLWLEMRSTHHHIHSLLRQFEQPNRSPIKGISPLPSSTSLAILASTIRRQEWHITTSRM